MPEIEGQVVQENVQESDAPAPTTQKLTRAPRRPITERIIDYRNYKAIEIAIARIAKQNDITKKQVVNMIAFSSDPQAREFWLAIQQESPFSKKSVPWIARKLGLTSHDVYKMFRQGYKTYQTIDYDIRGMKKLPEIGDGLFDSALPKDIPCATCHGKGVAGKQGAVCTTCGGNKTVREPAELKRIELALKSLGIIKEVEQNVAVPVTVNVGATESLESLIRRRDQVLYAEKVVDSAASPSDEDKQ